MTVSSPRMALLRALRAAAVLAAAASFSLAAAAADLTVSAAASLTDAFSELAAPFEAQFPGVHVQFNFGASGVLLQQMAQGAPVDVFASADEATMDQAQAQHLIDPAGRRDFASNTLVLIVPAAAAQGPGRLEDLRQPAYTHVAVGVPASVPAGRYAQAALQRAGLWDALQPRLVGAQSVRQALDYVARAEADAGFVYASDAASMPGKVKVALAVATATPILYPAAPVAGSTQGDAARRFVAFLLTPAARRVLAQHGFGTP